MQIQIKTLLKNKFILRNLLKEYDITIVSTNNTTTVVSYLISDTNNSLDKIKQEFKDITGHPLIVI